MDRIKTLIYGCMLSFFVVFAIGIMENWLQGEFSIKKKLIVVPSELSEDDDLLRASAAAAKCLREAVTEGLSAEHEAQCRQKRVSPEYGNDEVAAPIVHVNNLSIGSIAIRLSSFFVDVENPGNGKIKSGFVILLEWLIVLCLAVQFWIILLSYRHKKYFGQHDDRFFLLGDWALNSPPVLGVLANLYAFAQLLSNELTSLNASFMGYFSEAVVTTLLGGGVYILILFLRIFARPLGKDES